MKVYDGAGDDRRQIRRARSCRCASRVWKPRFSPGSRATQVRTPLVPQGHGDDPGAGRAEGPGQSARQGAAAGGGRRSLRDHVRSLLQAPPISTGPSSTAVAAAAQKHGLSRIALEDPTSPALSYRDLLIGARILGAKLMPLAPAGQSIGLMLPNANAAGAAFLGADFGQPATGDDQFLRRAGQRPFGLRGGAGRTIVTSRAFIEKAKLRNLVERVGAEVAFLYLEDLRSDISTARQATRPCSSAARRSSRAGLTTER